MKLRMLYFASLRERIGVSEETLDVPASIVSVAQLRGWLAERGTGWAEAFAERTVRAAVDQTMVNDDHALIDGAEVAFFPPVTGG